MADQFAQAMHVSRVGVSSQFGGDTYTIKVHFHTRDHAEVVKRLLEKETLLPGPFPQQAADQADLIDIDKLRRACVWYGYAPPGQELLGWWVGREVNRLLDLILAAKEAKEHRVRACDGAQPVAWLHEFTDPHDGTRRRATWMNPPHDYDLQPGDTVTPLYAALGVVASSTALGTPPAQHCRSCLAGASTSAP